MMNRTLTIKIQKDTYAELDAMGESFIKAWNTEEYQGEYRVYSSPEQLFRVLTPLRWSILDALQKQKEWIGLRPLSRLLERDPTAVLRDLTALAEEGIVEKDASGKWICPFSVIHTDFTIEHAA
jgi:predicted transcriptional regulator